MILWTYTLFFIVPLLLDAFHYVESYTIYPALGPIAYNPGVTASTNLIVLLGAALLARATHRASQAERAPIHTLPAVRRWAWLVLAFCPLIVVAGAPDPGVYSHFAAAISLRGPGQPFYLGGGIVPPAAHYHVYVTWSTYLSAVALCLWLLERRSGWAFVAVIPVGFMDYWIAGKRNIIALIAILTVYAISQNRVLNRREFRRLAACSGLALIAVLLISQEFQSTYRSGVQTVNSREVFKVDFGRIDVLRLSVAGQLGMVPRPLDYPGQSFSLYADAVTGRLTGTEKQVSYQDRVTSIAFDVPIQDTGGAITTSLISESIDNFGWIGALVGPILLTILIRRSSRTRDPVLALMLALTGCLLLVTEVLVVVPLFGIVVLRWAWRRYKVLLSPRRSRSSLARDQRGAVVLGRTLASPGATTSTTQTASAPRPSSIT